MASSIPKPVEARRAYVARIAELERQVEIWRPLDGSRRRVEVLEMQIASLWASVRAC